MRLLHLSLTPKFILVLLLAVLPNALLLMRHAEEQLEKTLVDQVKKQAVVFLEGVERRIELLPDPLHPVALDGLLRDALSEEGREGLDFTTRKLYLFAADGQVRADTRQPPPDPTVPPGAHLERLGKVDMKKYYGQVIHRGETYISPTIELYPADRPGAPEVPVIDVIVPVRVMGELIGGLEAELDMAETLAMVKEADNAYERELMMIVGGYALALMVVLWAVLHRMLVRPIRRYERTTRAIAGGNLDHRIPPPLPTDEIGHLGGSINVMADSIARLIREQEEAYLQTLQSLAKALEAKDAYTAKHSARVAKYSVLLGRELGLEERELELLKKGALMHDLGKIGIADAILNKPAALTDEEYAEMRRHPTHTATIMRPLKRFKAFTDIAAWHHEHWNGTGYPDGLKGEEIPLLARIVSIADTWDAMTGDRVYRKGMPKEKALGIMEAERDRGQWDPNLIRVFVAMVRREMAREEEAVT